MHLFSEYLQIIYHYGAIILIWWQVARELADAKRRGKIREGPLDAKAGTSKAGKARGGGEFSRSSKFFGQLQADAEAGAAKHGKRRRGAGGVEGADDGRRAHRFKL